MSDVAESAYDLALAMARLERHYHTRMVVTRDFDGTEERCVDCSCEVTAGDLVCERCDDIRQQTEQALSGGDA
jgi:hypothetical protein